ncbi:hypothetical protein K7432_014463 [Basidiobolus ranarum]|uniref:Putative gamma-glutamylcyclotransferase n=1 Tax=Basidiobolus ranarum TaxID=34480 RepID=A0ABR2VPG1_9FUNG
MSSFFFYGTLMSPEVIFRVISNLHSSTELSKLKFTPAILKGYKRRQVVGAKYPAIFQSTHDLVEGMVVSGFSEDDKRLLDVYEGDQYSRHSVQVETVAQPGSKLLETPYIASENLVVETYVWKYGSDGLSHLDWDFKEFVNKSLTKWVASKEEFQEVDRYYNKE